MVVFPEPCKAESDESPKNKDAVVTMQECRSEKVAEFMFQHFDLYFDIHIKGKALKNAKNFNKYLYFCKRTGGIIVSVYHSETVLPGIDILKRAKAWERGSLHEEIDNGLARMSVWYTKRNIKLYGPSMFMENGKFVLPDEKVVFSEVAKHIAANGYTERAKVIAARSVDLARIMSRLRHSILLSEF